jgi:diguanylate cyclase (GGDEF)-like protein/PAS domain S-box-containing protein
MQSPGQHERNGLRILLADDTLASARLVAAYLKQDGHEVVHVMDGKQAVEAFEAEQPDLVLMDVMMPVMDGIEATRQIKAKSSDHWVPLIMITGLSEKRDLIAGLQAGADDYLTKPVDPHELAARIHSMTRIIGVQRRLHAILDHAFDGIVGVDERGTIQLFNQAAERLFGYGATEIIGLNIDALMSPPDGQGQAISATLTVPRALSDSDTLQVTGRRKGGEVFLMELAITEIRQPDGAQFICMVRDISQVEAARQRIEFLAHHDQLTGLPNRTRFSDTLAEACHHATETPSAVLFIDLDDFKPINDRFGHEIGDIALQIVAKRLRAALDERDFVARLGGDEFVALLADIPDGDIATRVGQRLIDAIGRPMVLRDQTCQLGASIGIALVTGHDPAPDKVLSDADNVMYTAKRAGKNRVALATTSPAP